MLRSCVSVSRAHRSEGEALKQGSGTPLTKLVDRLTTVVLHMGGDGDYFP